MEGNEAAPRLYRKLGFREVARFDDYVEYYGELRALVRMKGRS